MSDLGRKRQTYKENAQTQREQIQRQHIANLKSYMNTAPQDNKKSIQHVIDMYQDKKIPNIKSALNVAELLAKGM